MIRLPAIRCPRVQHGTSDQPAAVEGVLYLPLFSNCVWPTWLPSRLNEVHGYATTVDFVLPGTNTGISRLYACVKNGLSLPTTTQKSSSSFSALPVKNDVPPARHRRPILIPRARDIMPASQLYEHRVCFFQLLGLSTPIRRLCLTLMIRPTELTSMPKLPEN